MAKLSKQQLRLVKRLQRGDAQAFERLWRDYGGRVFNLARRVLADAQEAEDVCQDVAVKVLKSVDSLREAGAFRTWLFRMTVLTCYDRNRRKRPQALDLEQAEALGSVDRGSPLSPPPPLPEQALERAALSGQLRQLVSQLPPAQLAALYLFYYEELSYKEIAAVLGVSTATVGTNIRKAKLRLGDWLAQETTKSAAGLTLS